MSFIWKVQYISFLNIRSLFPAINLSIGSFQDGGLKHNNPIGIGIGESRHIWPENSSMDVVLSLGTGTTDGQSQINPHYRHRINDGFIPRLYRSFMSSLDGEHSWKDMINRLDDTTREDYFRFNIEINGSPDIDNITRMDEWRDTVRQQSTALARCEEVVSALLVSSFFFELEKPPEYERGFFRCDGFIRCRSNCNNVVKAVERLCDNEMEFLLDSGVVAIFEGRNDICRWCQRYRKKITFYVRHPSDQVTLSLRMGEHSCRRLSGFPQTMEWFVKMQELDGFMGVADHKIPGKLDCFNCEEPGLASGKRKSARVSHLRPKRARQV